ncbi:Oidioi.mRNA.OKI2018_I69.chr2.g6547.t1.cds [Oikopleura dioica]|uniref:Oidioi.mRNA.OKI2018_I69.chr2.g6547.t1.cds n=1 Tax=Oikopleura dioica TaxID=34765 RepID=A0ABN7T3T7_OIKDI|nr:Oidioi.mRNA.OKI2018_I69.chr2.g6547.t1.cds [Oikopleura dioica]
MRCRTLWLPAMLYAKVAAVLRKIPQDQYHQRLHSWEEAEILVTNSEGEFVSHDVHHFAELSQQRHHRRRRNAELYQLHSSRSNDEHESFFVNITTGSFTHHLKLVHSGIQLHPDAKIIHNHHNYTTHEDFHPSYHSCFMTGHVVGKEKLSTSLSLCGEVQGLLELDDEHWFIEQPHPDEKTELRYISAQCDSAK